MRLLPPRRAAEGEEGPDLELEGEPEIEEARPLGLISIVGISMLGES
jgi:hypothetical protein